MDWLRKSGFIKDNRLSESFSLLLTKTEKEWLERQALEECTSQISIVRKSINLYRKSLESK